VSDPITIIPTTSFFFSYNQRFLPPFPSANASIHSNTHSLSLSNGSISATCIVMNGYYFDAGS